VGSDEAEIVGVGLGLRSRHVGEILAGAATCVPWFEVLADNYAFVEGPPLEQLGQIRQRYPVVFHGVGMSLGGADALDDDYLGRIADLARRFEPVWISEHLAWTSLGGRHFHELLPLPYNEESVVHVGRRIRSVQDRLGHRILVENAASYLSFRSSTLSEVEFVNAVLVEADCDLLLDVNNLYVNAFNHGFDPESYLRALPRERVRQMHLAGHDDRGRYLIDAHGSPVCEPVWALYEQAVSLFPDAPTCIEWDRDIPPLEALLVEVKTAEARSARARGHERSGESAA
jgi:uncharacterized protein (UPF0276 family)